jgi:hypothetical protein
VTVSRVVPFRVFVSAAPVFAEIEPQWSFRRERGPGDLLAVGASYEDEAGIALMIETAAPGRRFHHSAQPLRFAVARAGVHRDDLGVLMDRAKEARRNAAEVPLELELDGNRFVAPALSYGGYVAGTADVGDQRVTVSGFELVAPVALRAWAAPLHQRVRPDLSDS